MELAATELLSMVTEKYKVGVRFMVDSQAAIAAVGGCRKGAKSAVFQARRIIKELGSRCLVEASTSKKKCAELAKLVDGGIRQTLEKFQETRT